MKQLRHFSAAAGLMAALAAAGCGTADVTTDELVGTSVSLAQGGSALASVVLDFSSDSGGAGPIRPALIDSLIVTVRRVDVLPSRRLHRCHPPVGDSVVGFRPERGRGPGPGDQPMPPDSAGFDDGHRGPLDHPDCRRGHDGPTGPGSSSGRPPHPPERPDSMDVPPDTGWGSRPWHWFSLAVLGNGRVDLLDLPTDSSDGILLAAGRLPPGEYVAARLIITSATIWFNDTIPTDSIVLLPDTGYTVQLPHRRNGAMGILTRSGFTVPDDGGDVLLLFDPDVTIGHVVVTGNGTILIRPVLRHHP